MPKHKPPSRVRYEKAHPTISLRVDQETKQRLKNVLENQSVASFIKEALGVREREKESLEQKYRKGYEDGYIEGHKVGFIKAKDTYEVYTYCSICDRKITITEEKEKEEIDMYFRNARLCHGECLQRRH